METPCINVCIIDEDVGICTGCGRTRREIGGWSSMTDADRRRVMKELPDRLKNK